MTTSIGLVYVIRDADPVSPGHDLVIPRRRIASLTEATEQEQVAMSGRR